MADTYRPGPRPHPTGYHYPRGEHHPEAVFVNAPSAPSDQSITKMTVPLLLVGSLVVFVSVGTYLVTSNFSEIKHSLVDIASKMEDLKNNLADRIDRVEREADVRSRDRYTRTQHDLWCSRTEQLNAGIGWKCADVDENSRYKFAPQINGWSASKKSGNAP